MKISNIIKKQLLEIKPLEEDNKKINIISNNFIKELKKNIKAKKIKADVFLGGSLAKNTLIKKDIYDIDIFIRFDKKYENLSNLLGKILIDAKKIHGSRDYYQVIKDNIIIEIIPVLKIKKPEEALNVTDLSFFHVNYILKKIKKNKNLVNETRLAKSFTHAQSCYGAESYIHGFSGYALELLICHYKTFINFIKNISKLNLKEKLIIDDAKFYKNKNIISELNESKAYSPIILIDPTFKERNALSSLSIETLHRFQIACKNFLKNPSPKFFIQKSLYDDFKNKKNIKIILVKTNKQVGDIAGTKSKKFFGFFMSKLKKEFDVKKSGFEYNEEENYAYFYISIIKKKSTKVRGPPINSLNNFKNFKAKHKDIFIKNGYAYVKLEHNLTFNNWLKMFIKNEKTITKDMGIIEIKLKY